LSGTSYDGIHLVYLDKMGGMATLMLKIFMMFSILSLASLALPGMTYLPSNKSNRQFVNIVI
jgi:NAD(P)H-quinone oxidoreductase subunit 4